MTPQDIKMMREWFASRIACGFSDTGMYEMVCSETSLVKKDLVEIIHDLMTNPIEDTDKSPTLSLQDIETLKEVHEATLLHWETIVGIEDGNPAQDKLMDVSLGLNISTEKLEGVLRNLNVFASTECLRTGVKK